MASTHELDKLIVRLVGDGSSYEKVLKAAVTATKQASVSIERAAKQAMAKQSKTMKEAARITESVATPTERYKRQLKELNAHQKEGRISTETHTRALKELNREFSKGEFRAGAFAAKLKSVGGAIRGIGTKLLLGVTLPVAGMIKAFSDFDSAMTQSLSIMGDVSAELKKGMADEAKHISQDSITSAHDLAEAYFFLASAGFNAAQSITAIGKVEKFAVAGMFDMSTATDLLTDAQSALGMTSKDTEKNMRGLLAISDTLVKANTLANASVRQFSEALTSDAGSIIRQYNMDLNEGVAILAAYADKGKKAAEAGNLFGRMSRLLVKSIKDNQAAFTQLGIETEEFATTGKNIIGVLDGITQATAGMGPVQTAAILSMLGFETLAQKAITPLLGMTEQMRGYEVALKDAAGTTEDVADKQLKSFASQTKILWNNIKGVSKSIGEVLAPYVLALNLKIRKLLDAYNHLSPPMKKFIALSLGVLAVLGPLLIVIGTLIIMIGGAILIVAQLAAGFALITTAGLATAGMVVGVIAAIGAAIKIIQIITDRIWGPGSFSGALGKAIEAMKNFASKVFHYLVNIQENFAILIKWLPQNWEMMIKDLGQMWVVYTVNAIKNLGTMLWTFVRLFTLWAGHMVNMFKNVFSVDFIKWVYTGIQRAADIFVEFSLGAWEALKSIFSGGKASSLIDLSKRLGEELANDFNAGFKGNFLEGAETILKEQMERLVAPLDGFESNIVQMPGFNLGPDGTKRKHPDDKGGPSGGLAGFALDVGAAMGGADPTKSGLNDWFNDIIKAIAETKTGMSSFFADIANAMGGADPSKGGLLSFINDVMTKALAAGFDPAKESLNNFLDRMEALGNITPEMEEAAKSITEAMRTPMEVYEQELKKLNELRKVDLISLETYNRALEKAQSVLPEVKKAQEDYNNLLTRAKSVTDSVATPQEVYNKKLEELNVLKENELITQETYSRALEKAKDIFDKAESDVKPLTRATPKEIKKTLVTGSVKQTQGRQVAAPISAMDAYNKREDKQKTFDENTKRTADYMKEMLSVGVPIRA